MYEYNKEHWKEAIYDAVEFDEMDEDESDEMEAACNDMLDAAIEVMVENAICVSRVEYFKKMAALYKEEA